MTPSGLSLDIFPNEIIREIFAHLSLEQQVGLSRISLLWRFLVGTFLGNVLEASYPFLAEELEKASPGKCLAKLNNLQKICAELAARYNLNPLLLQSESLKAFSLRDKDKDDHFDSDQITFLKEFMVASGIVENDNDVQEGTVFTTMVHIGNLKKIKQWSEKNQGGKIPLPWGRAFYLAACGDHLECLDYLSEKCEGKITCEDKEWALNGAAHYGNIKTVKYLIKKYGKEISEGEKAWAIQAAIESGHLACVVYLIEKCGQEISTQEKEWLCNVACQSGQVDCTNYLIETCTHIFNPLARSLTYQYSDGATKDLSRVLLACKDNLEKKSNNNEKRPNT